MITVEIKITDPEGRVESLAAVYASSAHGYTAEMWEERITRPLCKKAIDNLFEKAKID